MKKKSWILIGCSVALILFFLFSDGVRQTFVRKRAIKQAEAELARLNTETEQTRSKIATLENSTVEYEHLVRKELGYLKPGEKEARFIKK